MERTRGIPKTTRFALAVVVALALSSVLPAAARAATYYVAPAPAGSDGNAGTMASPFASFARAQTAAAPGDTVYFRAGSYAYHDNNSADATGDSINVSKSGSSGKLINVEEQSFVCGRAAELVKRRGLQFLDAAGHSVSDADFQSVSATGVDGPRQADGILPNIPFMKLRADSDLIDKGANVGLTFSGAAADLGAFENPAAAAGAGGGTASGGMSGAEGSNAGSSGGGTAGGGGSAGAGGSDTTGGSGPSGGASVAGSGETAGVGAGGATTSAMTGAGGPSSGGPSSPSSAAGASAAPVGAAGAGAAMAASGGSGAGCSCRMAGFSGHPLRSALALLAFVAALLRSRRRARGLNT